MPYNSVHGVSNKSRLPWFSILCYAFFGNWYPPSNTVRTLLILLDGQTNSWPIIPTIRAVFGAQPLNFGTGTIYYFMATSKCVVSIGQLFIRRTHTYRYGYDILFVCNIATHSGQNPFLTLSCANVNKYSFAKYLLPRNCVISTAEHCSRNRLQSEIDCFVDVSR